MYEQEDTTVPKDEFYEAQSLWTQELTAAKKEWEDFQERGDKILEFYIDDRKQRRVKRYPLFNSNVSILENALFARIPSVDVSRRFKDPDDQVGRVAAVILQRSLATELERGSSFKNIAKSIIKDMLVPGLGCGWVRYEAHTDQPIQLTNDENDPLASNPEASVVLKDQQTPIDYVHWKDVRISPCRTWNEARWVGRRVFMDEAEAKNRFGERAEWLCYTDAPFAPDSSSTSNEPENTIEPQAAVWEIWDKTTKKVYFICETCPTALDIKDDYLGLPEFFPTDRPLVANISTSNFTPSADYTQLQDQYNDLNETNNRIARLVKACRLAGVYDESQGNVKMVLEGAAEHQLIPVKGWGGFRENGGLKGAIEFLPLVEIAAVLSELRQHLESLKQQIYELTGISDIVRGASSPYETAAAQGMKAQYASIRLQGKQTDVAEYLTGLIQRKAFLMLKFYTPERLMERCGVLPQADQQYVPAALQLLQDDLLSSLRLEVSSDALQQPNWAKDQAEKSQTITAISQLMAQALPAVQQIPELGPMFLHLIKWSVAGNPGAREIEGVIEMGLQQAMQASQQPKEQKPDPAQIAAQEAQQKLQFEQQKAQADLALQKQKFEQEMQFEREKFSAEMQFEREKAGAELSTKRDVEMTKAQQKNVPQFVHGNTGIDEEQLLEAMTSLQQTTLQAVSAMQHTTVQAITELANQPAEPATVVMTRDEDGNLVGTMR